MAADATPVPGMFAAPVPSMFATTGTIFATTSSVDDAIEKTEVLLAQLKSINLNGMYPAAGSSAPAQVYVKHAQTFSAAMSAQLNVLQPLIQVAADDIELLRRHFSGAESLDHFVAEVRLVTSLSTAHEIARSLDHAKGSIDKVPELLATLKKKSWDDQIQLYQRFGKNRFENNLADANESSNESSSDSASEFNEGIVKDGHGLSDVPNTPDESKDHGSGHWVAPNTHEEPSDLHWSPEHKSASPQRHPTPEHQPMGSSDFTPTLSRQSGPVSTSGFWDDGSARVNQGFWDRCADGSLQLNENFWEKCGVPVNLHAAPSHCPRCSAHVRDRTTACDSSTQRSATTQPNMRSIDECSSSELERGDEEEELSAQNVLSQVQGWNEHAANRQSWRF